MHNAIIGAPVFNLSNLARASEYRVEKLIARILTRSKRFEIRLHSASISDGYPLDEDTNPYSAYLSKSSGKRVSRDMHLIF